MGFCNITVLPGSFIGTVKRSNLVQAIGLKCKILPKALTRSLWWLLMAEVKRVISHPV